MRRFGRSPQLRQKDSRRKAKFDVKQKKQKLDQGTCAGSWVSGGNAVFKSLVSSRTFIQAIKASGQALERVLKMGSKTAIQGFGIYRIPDMIDKLNKVIYEAKNVNYLRYTQQLKDMAYWAEQSGYKMVIYVQSEIRGIDPRILNNRSIEVLRVQTSEIQRAIDQIIQEALGYI